MVMMLDSSILTHSIGGVVEKTSPRSMCWESRFVTCITNLHLTLMDVVGQSCSLPSLFLHLLRHRKPGRLYLRHGRFHDLGCSERNNPDEILNGSACPQDI